MNSITKRAQVGDSVPYSERTNLGQQRSKAMLKRVASLKPNLFEQYAWTLKEGGTMEAANMVSLGFKGAKDLTMNSIVDTANAVYNALTPVAGANSQVQKPSVKIGAAEPAIAGLIKTLVGPCKEDELLDMVYTSGMYSLVDLQQFASGVAGAIVGIREDLVDEILAPKEYYDRSLNTLTLRQGLDNAGKDI